MLDILDTELGVLVILVILVTLVVFVVLVVFGILGKISEVVSSSDRFEPIVVVMLLVAGYIIKQGKTDEDYLCGFGPYHQSVDILIFVVEHTTVEKSWKRVIL